MNTINYPDPARLLEFKPQSTGNVQVMETQPAVAADRKLGNLTFQELQLLLTPHFSLWEMVRSGTAIRLGIDNRPQPEHIARMRALCENVLEPLRRRFGVIRITSGFRCPALNRAVHGVSHSQHLYGEAADIHVPNRRAAQRLFEFIRHSLPFDQLLLERINGCGTGWIHVSYRSDRGPNRELANSNFQALYPFIPSSSRPDNSLSDADF